MCGSMEQANFPFLNIPDGSYLKILYSVEETLPSLLEDEAGWNSVDVNYHPPRVERVWRQQGDYRIYLHRIHPPKETDNVLFHPHPWPSSMRILHGVYKMPIGFGPTDQPAPPVAATLILTENSVYEMVNPNGWHAVSPVGGITYSLMVAGRPWACRENKSGLVLNELSREARRSILSFFRIRYSANKTFNLG